MPNILSLTVIRVSAALASGAGLQPKATERLSLLQHKAALQTKGDDGIAWKPTWNDMQLFTMHGCECAKDWHHKGLTEHGCVYTDGYDLPWCFVRDADSCKRGYEKTALLGGEKSSSGICSNATSCAVTDVERDGKWDFCSLNEEVDVHFTQNGCHCLPTWELQKKLYSGCSEPEENSSAWCYTAESDCKGAQTPSDDKHQHWDDCHHTPGNTPSFFTRNSCHCKPVWMHDGKKQTSCVPNAQIKPPDVLAAANATLENAQIYGWCHVFEDERECTGASIIDGHHMDACFMQDEASVKQFESTLHGCHCLPEWTLDGIVYQGCSRTTGVQEDVTWCRVAEDLSVCPYSLGSEHATPGGAGRGAGRWDWCRPNGKTQEWRLPDERFTPKEPEPPAWYQSYHTYQHAGMNDIDS
jgi:hypothetical protein